MERIKKFSILFVLVTILLNVFPIYSNAGEMATYAHKSYDSIMQESASSLIGKKFNDYLSSGDDDFRQKCERFLCIEKPAVSSWQQFYIYSIIDIDGSSPTTATYTTSSGSTTVTNNDIATLAYVSAKAEMNDSDDGSYSYSKAYSYVMNDLRDYIDSAIPYGTDYLYNSIVKGGKEYRDAVLNGTAEEVYSARIIVCQGGSMQTTALLYGKAGTNGSITVNKYVSNSGADRSSLSEDEKKASPAIFGVHGDEVVYNIVITSTYTNAVTVNVSDVFETNKTHGGLVISDYTGWTQKAANSYSRTVTIPAGSSETVTLKVKTYSKVLKDSTVDYSSSYVDGAVAYEETYKNTVTITGSGLNIAKNTTADYVKVGAEDIVIEEVDEPSGTIEKYVISVDSAGVGNRANRSNTDKNRDPVVVEKGDLVTYKIKVTNTSELDIYSCKMRDTAESGLTITNSSGLTGFSMDAGEEYETTVTVRVDKSNMYLFNLQNDIDFVSGKYTKVVKHTYTCLLGHKHTYYTYHENTPIPGSVVNAINSGNMDKDYVRLKELEIAGHVWLDDNKDGLMHNETMLKEIDVILRNADGSEAMSTVTDSDGYYEFSGFKKGTNFVQDPGCTGYYPAGATHKSYYVEFHYDGVRYIPTEYAGRTNLYSDNSYKDNYEIDSNAREYTAERDAFNRTLETIGYNKGIDRSGNVTNLEFMKSGHKSTLLWSDNTTMKSYSFVKNPDTKTKDNLFLSTSGETEYLKYINLGLVEREKVDLQITKDLLDSEVRINNHALEYEFGDYVANSLYDRTVPYELYIYKSDYHYRSTMYSNIDVIFAKAGTELEVDLRYKVVVKNDSPDVTYVRVNEIIDMYSNTMRLKEGVDVYMKQGESQKTLSVSNTSSYYNANKFDYDNYTVNFITGMDDVVLERGESFEIYLTYTLNKDSNGYIYLGEKTNIAQVSAYSTYEDETKNDPKGLVDFDSNAAIVNEDSIGVTEVAKYEDISFRVRTNIELKSDERQITGFVFEDARSELDNAYKQFTGNGVFDRTNSRNEKLTDLFVNGMKRDLNQDAENDVELDGMTVELIEVVAIGDDVYEETIDPVDLTNKSNVIVRTQTSGGKYVISSFIPGTYIVRFRYGDIYRDDSITENSLLHNGQDYKSTTYTVTNDSGTLLTSNMDNDTKYNALVKPNLSDARDNELRRLEVMAESEVMTHDIAEFMKYTNYRANNLNGDLREFVDATNCFADTVTFTLGIENKSDTKEAKGKEVAFTDFDAINLAMPNVDYGVVFRPENFIEVTKLIKNMKLVTSAGEVLVDVGYDIDGDIVKNIGIENVQSIDTNGGVQGFRYINVDEEVLQGSTLSVEYYIIADNIGEVDTVAQLLITEGGSAEVLDALNDNRGILKSNKVSGTNENYSRVDKIMKTTFGRDYDYGLFVGDIYYKGANLAPAKLVHNTVVVPVTVNKILDFVDNDAAFVDKNNNEVGKMWTVVTENELADEGLIGPSNLFVNTDGERYYKDDQGRRYTTEQKNNLVVNVPTHEDNPELVIPIVPKIYGSGVTASYIVIQVDAILAADQSTENMVYDNVAEIIEFTTPVGRRTNFASTIGNIEINGTKKPFEAAQVEVDTDGTEIIRLTPPTGMDRINLFIAANREVFTAVITTIVVLIMVYVVRFVLNTKIGKDKVYK